ncbi:MAG: sugar phosphate isomerase/epimerase family protein [Streptosporangiaceae bacterium]
MTSYRLGITTSFAVKRWPQPERWARLVRDELGLGLIQHSLDLVSLDSSAADVADQASWLRAACAAGGLTLHSTVTGAAAYTSNLLLHPDRPARDRAAAWYRRVIDFSADVGATAAGGHLGTYSVDDWRHPVRRRRLWDELRESVAGLAAHARDRGLDCLLAENQIAAREPSTLAGFSSLLTDGDAGHVPVALCLDVGHQCVPGTSGADRDPYQWLERLGGQAAVVQLQQTDGKSDRHWPFTTRNNKTGIITADRVLTALGKSGAAEVTLMLEISPAPGLDDSQALKDLRQSVDYWQRALSEHAPS